MVKFYSKLSPRQKFYTSDGHWLTFNIIDESLAVAAIDNEAYQKDIATATRENRGGITEITQEEYVALQGKKKEPSRKWREELSRSPVGVTHQSTRLPQNDPIAAVVAAGENRSKSEKVAKVAESAKPTAKKKK